MSHASRDRLVVRTLRCGRSNPGSNPGHGMPRKIFFEHPVNCCVFSILLCQNNRRFEITKKKIVCGSGGIRTHAPEETGALNQRLRPLGHATLLVAHAKKMPRNCTDG